ALGGPNFEVVALSIDTGGLPVVQTFFKQIGIRHLHPYLDTEHDAMDIGGTVVPLTLLIDAQGRELGRKVGPAKWAAPKMRELERLELPAGQTVRLAPSGTHLMLLQLKKPLRAGDSVALDLTVVDKAGRSHVVHAIAPVRTAPQE